MSNYIPKLGEECILHLSSNFNQNYRILIIGETIDEYWVKYVGDTITTVVSKTEFTFSPIPTDDVIEKH
jgi:hypothetical protein